MTGELFSIHLLPITMQLISDSWRAPLSNQMQVTLLLPVISVSMFLYPCIFYGFPAFISWPS